MTDRSHNSREATGREFCPTCGARPPKEGSIEDAMNRLEVVLHKHGYAEDDPTKAEMRMAQKLREAERIVNGARFYIRTYDEFMRDLEPRGPGLAVLSHPERRVRDARDGLREALSLNTREATGVSE